MPELLLRHIAQIATPEGWTAQHGTAMNKLKLYKDAAIFIENGRIAAVGSDAVLSPAVLMKHPTLEILDVTGKCVVPGFVDPHTHFLFGGARVEEFVDRLEGVPYLDLLQRGGGICSTMQATREASFENLYEKGKSVLQQMLHLGVTTVEGKSGYGLDLENEIKLLAVMQKLQQNQPVSLVMTYLGAHAVPPEYQGRADDYVDFILNTVLPVIQQKNLAEFVDVFCETGVFTPQQTEKILQAAAARGFGIKLHADEMSSTGGGGLASRLGAVSADHLLAVSEDDIRALAQSPTVAVLLPATAFCMRKPYAPARRMIDTGCAVALASDFNPGSCYTYSVPLILALAVIAMNMTMEEALTAMTLNAAAAVGRAQSCGSIEPGKQADLLVLREADYRYLVYDTGINIVEYVIKDGKLL
ncbi:MAG: imidazolonepropionase [Selenomonadaceae bacterium]